MKRTGIIYGELAKQEVNPFIGFKSFTRNVKFAVRTGDTTSYANYILRAGNIL